MGRLAARRSEITAINVFVKRKEGGREAENKSYVMRKRERREVKSLCTRLRE